LFIFPQIPNINSKGIAARGFNPKKYLRFYKIIDVWDWGWNEALGTVHPEEVNKATLEALRKYPHKIYNSLHSATLPVPHTCPGLLNKVGKNLRSRLLSGATRFVRWRVTELLGVKRAYQINLDLVLRYVARLIKHLYGGKIVITADHGELLGEHGLYGHSPGLKFPQLVEVPWFEVSKE